MKLLSVEKDISKGKALDMFSALKSGEVIEKKGKLHFDKASTVSQDIGTAVAFSDLIEYASRQYKISNKINDYAVVPVPIIITDAPNVNGVAFSAKALAGFAPDMGMPHFKSWIGKPTYEEHNNKIIEEAKGIIVDCVMNKVRNRPGYYKIVTLLSFDRTKDPILYDKITSGKSNAYSMGAYVGHYSCSICGAEMENKNQIKCGHITTTGVTFYRDYKKRLIYRNAHNVCGFEVSHVSNPAYKMAISDYVSLLENIG